MAAPVCGLRAVRALRWAVLNVPKPTNVIESPRLNDFVIPSMSDSRAADAPALDEPVSFAIFAIKSCLFMNSPRKLCRRRVNATALCTLWEWAWRLYASLRGVSIPTRLVSAAARAVRLLSAARRRSPADRHRSQRRVLRRQHRASDLFRVSRRSPASDNEPW